MCGTRLAENAGPKKPPNVAIWAPLHNSVVFATKAHIDIRKKPVKQQYVLQKSPQYGEHRPTNGLDPSVR